MARGASDVEWEDYQNGKYGGNQIAASLWNWFSNPMAAIPNLIGGNSPAAGNPDDFTTMFTDPFGVGNKIRGKTGAWNEELAKSENRDIFMSMTDADWEAFKNLRTDQQNAWIKKRRDSVGPANAAANAEAARKAKEAEYQKWRDQTLHQLQGFADKMNMSVDELIKSGDVGMMANRNQAANMAAQRGVGLSGGISDRNSQRAMADAAMKYQMGRQQMGQAAMGQVLNGLQTQYMNDEDRRRYEQGMNLQLQQAQAGAQSQKYMQQQQQASGLMGMVGGVIGGIYGGAGGAQAGSAAGQAIGGYSYGQSNPYTPYQYQYPGGTSGYGGGQNSGLSGAGGGYPKYGNSQ